MSGASSIPISESLVVATNDHVSDVNISLKSILSYCIDLFNGEIKHYLKIYTFDLTLNLPNITIYINTMLCLLTKEGKKCFI